MSCPEFKKRGLLYLSGELSPRRMEAYRLHLEECRECREEVEFLSGLTAAAKNLKRVAPSRSVRRTILKSAAGNRAGEGLVRQLRYRIQSFQVSRYWLWGFPTAATAVCLALLIFNPFKGDRQQLLAWNDDFISQSMAIDDHIDDISLNATVALNGLTESDISTISISSEHMQEIDESMDRIQQEITELK
jgi:anti-sigma factor RsiW